MAGKTVGPLAGVPIGIKDLVYTKGIKTTSGSIVYKDYVPTEDDVVVERLKAAGAIILGKTNVPEFGYSGASYNLIFPPTKNPWNTEHTAGGSSAGSGAAVAAGLGPMAIGSDGGGSVRSRLQLTGCSASRAQWVGYRYIRERKMRRRQEHQDGNRSSTLGRLPAPWPMAH